VQKNKAQNYRFKIVLLNKYKTPRIQYFGHHQT